MPRLRDDVHIAFVGDDAVILDLRQDHYFCILGGGTPDQGGSAALATLLGQSGLLAADPDAGGIATKPAVGAWHDLPAGICGRIGLGEVACFLVAFALGWARFVGRWVPSLLTHARRRPRSGVVSQEQQRQLAQAVRCFERLSAWLPARPACLFGSFVLLHFLWLRKLRAEWIFGVHLFPFRAHCWLAAGPCLVGAATDEVLSYTPILTVGSA